MPRSKGRRACRKSVPRAGKKHTPKRHKKAKGAFLGALVSALAPIAIEEVARRIRGIN